MSTTEPTPQNMRALRLANKIRKDRSELKRRIRAGEALIHDVILNPPREAAGMSLGALLSCQWRWAKTRTRRVLCDVGLDEAKRAGTLTDRQRRALVDAIELENS